MASAKSPLEAIQELCTAVPQAICLLDLEGRYLWVSERLAATNGMPAAEHLGRRPGELFPVNGPRLDERIQEVLRTGELAPDFELRGAEPDERGVIHHYLVSVWPIRDDLGEVIGAGSLMNDITERRLTERALAESEGMYRTLVEVANDAIFLADAGTGVILDCNRKAEELLGRGRQEIIGTHQTTLHPPEEAETYREEFLDHVRRKGAISKQLYAQRTDGTRVPVEISASIFQLGDMRLNLGLFRDVSERIQHRQALEKALEELRQLDEVKNNLLSNVSHELRTPLVAVRGYVELLLRREVDEAKAREWYRRVLQNCVRLERIIDSLIKISALHAGLLPHEPRSVDLAALVGVARDSLRPVLQDRGVSLQVSVPDDLPAVMVDEQQILSVLLNLMDNAAKFSKEGSTVTVCARVLEPSLVEVGVRDQGIGIPAEQRQRIFSRFYQVDASSTRAHGGFGVGLAIVKEVVEQHGGRVAVEEVEGGGSEFRITLPTAAAVSEPVEPGSVPEPRWKEQPAVMVVDDDLAVREFMSVVLEEERCRPIMAPSGEVALQLLEEVTPDLILLDLAMPGMPGLEVCRAIRCHATARRVPVLVFTARPDAQEQQAVLDAGADGVLPKPFSLAELRQVVEKHRRPAG